MPHIAKAEFVYCSGSENVSIGKDQVPCVVDIAGTPSNEAVEDSRVGPGLVSEEKTPEEIVLVADAVINAEIPLVGIEGPRRLAKEIARLGSWGPEIRRRYQLRYLYGCRIHSRSRDPVVWESVSDDSSSRPNASCVGVENRRGQPRKITAAEVLRRHVQDRRFLLPSAGASLGSLRRKKYG